MRLDGGGDRRVLALELGIFAAHGALQFGKFADHFGLQVSLGEHGGAAGKPGIGANRRRQFLRQPCDPLHPLPLGAELGVKGDAQMVEAGHALVERLFKVEAEFLRRGSQSGEIGQVGLVGLPKMNGVGQARTHHLGIAVRDFRTAVPGLDIGDQNEAVGEVFGLTLRAGDETFLVSADRQPHDFRRDVEEFLLELAHQHDRPFDQPRHFVEQPLVGDDIQPGGEGEVGGVGLDDLLAALGIEHDPGRLQSRDIVVKAAHGDGVRRVEAVTIGDVGGAEPVDLEVDHYRFLRLRAEGAQDRL
jgi:hypothetical protein